MARTTLLGAVLFAAALSTAPRAVAQSAAGSGDYQRAVALFEQSEGAYRAGDFARAAALLREAYALRREPILQYNLARALEGLGELGGAVDAYTAYLATSPAAPDRALVERRVATLRAQLARRAELERQRAALDAARRAEQRAREQAEATLRATRATDRTARYAGPIVLGSVGLAGVAAGAVLGALALATHGEAVAAPVQRDAFTLQQTAQDEALAANVAFVAGGALAAAALAWGIAQLATAPRPRVAGAPAGARAP